MSDRLRVAVVGLGIGWQHLQSYRALPELYDVVAVCDLDAEKASKAAAEFEVPHVLGDFQDVLELYALDVIDVCTPPHLHFEQAKAALASGRHAICEKPLVPSLALVDELASAERESGKRLMPIFQYRFGAGLQKLKHLVERGIAGRAYLTTVETAWTRGKAYYAVDWRGRWKTELGGVLLSHAIHAHDIVCYVLGPIANVFARSATLVNPIETEDCAAVSVEFADGSLASLSATLGSSVEISRLRFCFENLTAESGLAPYTCTFDPWTFTAATPAIESRMQEALRDFDSGHQLYAGQFHRFHAALASGGPLPVSLEDARAALELVTAMYHSAETHEPVSLPLASDHPKYESWLPSRLGEPREAG
jgi:predicted dehydrogenase